MKRRQVERWALLPETVGHRREGGLGQEGGNQNQMRLEGVCQGWGSEDITRQQHNWE